MSEAPPPAEPKPSWRSHPLLRRLPLLVVAIIGLVFLLPQAPHEVELEYDFGTFGQSARHLEIELRDARGVGVRRSELNLAPGARHTSQHLRLSRGDYRVTLTFESDGGSERAVRDFEVGSEEEVEVHL